MKKLLLIVLLAISSLINAQTNVYHQFPDSNAIWNFHLTGYCFSQGSADEYYSVTFAGDTVIDNYSYHKLITPFVLSYSTGTCGGSMGVSGLIREDISARKVYLIPAGDTAEYLLFDFTMQVGDSVRGYTQMRTFGQNDVVQGIDSVLVGTSYRKRWILNTCYNISMIEGIGWSYGFYNPTPGCLTDLAGYTLTCFSQNGQVQYPSTVSNCQLITSAGEEKEPRISLTIVPNPSTDNTRIVIEDALITEIHITDISGKVIIQGKNVNSSQFEIKDLAAGTYLVNVKDDKGKAVVRKLVRF